MLTVPNVIIWEWARMFQNHLWQEPIKTEKDMQLDRSTYEVLQILSISLTDKTHLRDLFDRTKYQNIKERFRLNEPNLFKF